ncbi:MAG: hypothetical protein PF637_12485 [Spirochaetes bacterium]|nr:hypothetical protein [Spirochaetota bacterium]
MMRTSVNFRETDLERIEAMSGERGLSRSEFICICLKNLFASNCKRLQKIEATQLVEYQPDGEGYCQKNVVFENDVYRLALNFRDFCRISVSFIVSLALDLFFEQIGDKKEIVHNYAKFYYNLDHILLENGQIWHVKYKNPPS